MVIGDRGPAKPSTRMWGNSMTTFLESIDVSKGRWRGDAAGGRGIDPVYYWTGPGRDALEVAYAVAAARPHVGDVRTVWKRRQGRAASPLLLVVSYPEGEPTHALLCGPTGDDPPVVDVDLAQAERIAAAALAEPNRHLAIRFLAAALEAAPGHLPGLRNKGLLATHELRVGVPQRADWSEATTRAAPLLGLRDRDLVRGLGFTIEPRAQHFVLRAGGEAARAVAVFLQDTEQPDQPAARYNNQTPVTYALTHADRDSLPWVVAVRNGTIRLYSTATSGAAGQRGRAETFLELNLPLLPSNQAGYLHLLFSADALGEGGTVEQIQRDSALYTARLSERLRELVYVEVVPRLAIAVADEVGGTSKPELTRHYRTALTILFRLLCIAYAEDSRLLPLHINSDYTHSALKTLARNVADRINAGEDLGFDNPFTPEVEPTTDADHTDLWERAKALFHAVDKGHTRWSVPRYDGGLFSADSAVNPVGEVIERLSLPNGTFGPALTALLVDRGPDGVIGPIDFRSLSVREFGTIYEGLLESELSIANQPLTLDADGTYVPAAEDESPVVPQGGVYLHNRSGARKASGSYFTKPFAVEHLVTHAVEPTLAEHLDSVAALLEEGREADAADRLFDFRVADIAMGSGHFLTAVVDHLEARYTEFLTDHPIPQVTAELDRLRAAALNALGSLAEQHEVENASLLRRLIARRCVYGVDINPISVELARVSMWIHTFVPGLPLSFLNHNLVVGDSLTGVATVKEATDALVAAGQQASLFDDPILEVLRQAREPLGRLASLVDATPTDIIRARKAAAEVERAVAPVRELFDLVVAARTGMIEPPAFTSMEDMPTLPEEISRTIDEMNLAHFPALFPEVFLRDLPGFDIIVGNPPWEEVVIEELAFWALRFPGLNGLPTGEQQREIRRLRRVRPDLVEQYNRERDATERLRTILHAGPYPGMGTGDPDLYKAFSWRFTHLVRTGGAIGVVLPRSVFTTKGSGEWRSAALSKNDTFVTTLRNTREWVFDDVNPGYTVCLVTLRQFDNAAVPRLRLAGRYEDLASFRSGVANGGAVLGVDLLAQRDESLALPDLSSDDEGDLFAKLLQVPGLGDADRTDFTARAVTDFHATNDRKKGFLDANADYPVYNHVNVGHFRFEPEQGPFTYCDWDTAVSELRRRQVDGSRKGRSAFSDMYAVRGMEWLNDESTVPVRNPRIAFRDVVHASNKRKVWAALLPASTVLTNTAPHLVFPHGDVATQAFLLGVLNSSICDWYGHLFIGLHLNYFILYGLPVPVFNASDPRCARLARLAASLAVNEEGNYGDWRGLVLDERTDRPDQLAELDGITSLLYGLEEGDLPLIWNDRQLLRPQQGDVRRHRDAWSKS